MKLQSVETIAIDIPLAQNFGGSTYGVLKRSTVITRLRTKERLTSNVYNGDKRAHAGEIARLIEHLNIAWFEEPCHWYDETAMMARVRKAIRIPVTAGQSEISCQGVRRLLDAGAVDYVNYDVSEGGGVTDWRRVAALCATARVQMAHHEQAQVASQLLAAVPHGTYAECFAHPNRDPIWQRMWINRPQVKNGMIAVSSAPGFGIELDEKMLKKYRVA